MVGVRSAGIKVNRVPCFERRKLVAMMNLQLTLQHIKKLKPGMHVGLGLHVLGQRHKLGKVRVHVSIRHHVGEALKKVGGRSHAGLRQAHPLVATMDAEYCTRFGVEEIGKVLGENHRNARQVTQRWHNTARLKLRKKTRGEPRMLAKFNQSHGLFQTQPLDALANPLFRDKTLGGFRIDLGLLCFLALDYRRITHLPPSCFVCPHRE